MALVTATSNIGTTNVASALVSHGAAVKQASVNSVRCEINTGGVTIVSKRAASLVVRAEGRSRDAPTSPMSTPPGSDEFPLGVIASTAPLEQGTDKPVGERIAYVCQDCGYVYDQETPFEDVSDDYNCPQCAAPKMRFLMANASVEEMLDTTEEDDAVSRGSGVKSGSPPTQN